MKILLIEPFNGGSHAAWAQGYCRHSSHTVEILGLPGKNWKWRMQGAAVTLARRYHELLENGKRYDLILASDMFDLAVFLGLIRNLFGSGSGPPVALYFHENQLTYPQSPNEQARPAGRDRQYGLINFTSALAADACFFNSAYHRRSFIEALPDFLGRFPDCQELDTVAEIEKKSEVLHLGLDLERLLSLKPADNILEKPNRPPLILWNHRWEYDKNPADFFAVLRDLVASGRDFEVAILGEHYHPPPELFLENREFLGRRLLHFGYAESFADYAAWLWRADILPVTSYHDFFGAGVIEAVYCNCYPLLPRRLAYPEHLPGSDNDRFFYLDYNGLCGKLKHLLDHMKETRSTRPGSLVADYDWSVMAPQYDEKMTRLVN
jgi:glycosyltransferase involved in cell wall biosynthesis